MTSFGRSAGIRAAVRGASLALVWLAIAVPSIRAQTITGKIAEQGTGTAIAGAVVMLSDDAGALVARTLSDTAGSYHFSTKERAGTLRVMRIGFAPETRRLASLPTGKIDIALSRIAVVLPTVEAFDQRECPRDSAGGLAFALWDQARTALLATVVGREANPALLHMVSYDRLLSVDRRRIISQNVQDTTFHSIRGIVSARTAQQYDSLGYRDLDDRRGVERYYAPDADILLDPTFVSGHCFSVRATGGADPSDIGLTFTPRSASGDRVDIRGTIWLRRRSPALQSIEFQFTSAGLSRPLGDTLAGGTMIYREMRNGVSLPVRWSIHAPVRGRQAVRVGARTINAAVMSNEGIRESGAQILNASWSDGTSWDAALPRASGRVVDEKGNPTSGVVLSVRGTAHHTATDSLGAFQLQPLPAGTYVVDVVDSALADFGLTRATTAAVIIDSAKATTLEVKLPSRARLVDSLCAENDAGARSEAGHSALVLGVVHAKAATTGTTAAIRASWRVARQDADTTVLLRGQADSSGRFQICGVPIDTPVRLSATADSSVARDVIVVARQAGDVASAALTLRSRSDADLPAYRHRYVRVSDLTTDAPIPNVDVVDVVDGQTIGVTADDGRLALASVPEGRAMLRLRRAGYAPKLVIVDVQPSNTAPVAVQLQHVVQLDATIVTASATASKAAIAAGFDTRLMQHRGRFLGTADLDHQAGEPLSSVLLPLGIRQQNRGTAVVLLGGRTKPCPVTIYVDGILFYSYSSRGAEPPDARTLIAGDYGAIEYYAETELAPSEFTATGAGCGTLLLWTRDQAALASPAVIGEA